MKFVLAAALVALSPINACSAAPACATPNAAAEFARVDIRTKAKRYEFQVEVVRTPEAQARGMMFRETLARNCGMIFPFSPPREASFWMRNTLIPLDMIFIRADGSIARIAAETIPYSLEPETSGEPVASVLEIGGGEAARLGISEGDIVKMR